MLLAATGGDVPRRVRALLNPPRLRWSRPAAAVLTAMALTVLTSSAVVASTTEHRFERAQADHPQPLASTNTDAPDTPAATDLVLPR